MVMSYIRSAIFAALGRAAGETVVAGPRGFEEHSFVAPGPVHVSFYFDWWLWSAVFYQAARRELADVMEPTASDSLLRRENQAH
jgi:hypothetical protein